MIVLKILGLLLLALVALPVALILALALLYLMLLFIVYYLGRKRVYAHLVEEYTGRCDLSEGDQ